MDIDRLDPSDAAANARWDAFVFGCGEATFFHRAGWQKILRKVFRHDTHYLLAQCDGRIEGVLPLAHVNSLLFGNALVSLPFAVYAGVAASSDEAAQALEAEAQRLAQKLGVAHLELRHMQPRHTDWPRQDLYVTFRKAIAADEEANMLAIPRKQRAMVRKGIANGLKAVFDADNARFFELYSDNVHRHGTPAMSRRYFDTLRATFGERCRARARRLQRLFSFTSTFASAQPARPVTMAWRMKGSFCSFAASWSSFGVAAGSWSLPRAMAAWKRTRETLDVRSEMSSGMRVVPSARVLAVWARTSGSASLRSFVNVLASIFLARRPWPRPQMAWMRAS